LFNAKSAIVHIYHDEKYIFNEMMMGSALF